MSEDHHLILGTTRDFVTGETIPDTHDERYRQGIARYLVEKKGYEKENLRTRIMQELCCGEECRVVMTDILVVLGERAVMLIRYGPGSLVSRERPALAAARTLAQEHRIPITVVTNGLDAEVIETDSGRVKGIGLEVIPSMEELLRDLPLLDFSPWPPERIAVEKRILLAYEALEDSCGCGPRASDHAREPLSGLSVPHKKRTAQ